MLRIVSMAFPNLEDQLEYHWIARTTPRSMGSLGNIALIKALDQVRLSTYPQWPAPNEARRGTIYTGPRAYHAHPVDGQKAHSGLALGTPASGQAFLLLRLPLYWVKSIWSIAYFADRLMI